MTEQDKPDAVAKKYFPTIGLEVHAELKTITKMFCRCKNDPDETRPNVNVCPVCIAHPGTLPTINMQAVEHMVRIGLSVGGEIANFSEFDRKNYFYPDIPKGYQISQYQYPIVSGGELAGVKLTRIHLEEDTGTSKHDQGDFSLVDFNRAGVPLMELVTEPVMHSPEEVTRFARELQLLLRYLDVGEANMEKGEMRVEVNVSVSPDPNKMADTYVEIKNINSISAAGKAAEYEINRMINLHEAGRADEIVKETRGWDENKSKTVSQRKKEDSHDYRYFPDPDLPKMHLHEIFDLEQLKSELPELPSEKRDRYRAMYGIKDEDIESYVVDDELGVFFENVAIMFDGNKDLAKLASNYVTSDIIGMMKNSELPGEILQKLDHEAFAKLIKMNHEDLITSRATKNILEILIESGGDPQQLAEQNGMLQQNDEGALTEIAQTIINENPSVVDDVKAGKEKAIKFLVGQGMKATKGSANPQKLEELFKQLIS